MAATNIKGGRVADGTITRDDLNDTTTTKAVIKKVTAQNGVRIASSSGVDAGTGDVVLEADLTYLSTKYPSLLTNQTQNYVFAAPSSGAGNPVFRPLVTGDIPNLPVSAITSLQSLLDAKPNDWSSLSGKPTTFAPTAHTHTIGDITDLATQLGAKQPLDADLTAIAALSGASGLPRKTALNTWVLDTATYLTANQNITVSGDATGSGTTAIALTLASVVTAGTYRSVTVDAKGRVTAGTNPTTMAGYGLTADFATQWNAIWDNLAASGIANVSQIVAGAGNIFSLSTGTLSVDGQLVDGGFSQGVAGQFLQSFDDYTLWTTLTTALISDFTANVLGQTLDGFVVGSATELTDTDTILSGLQNLQAQVSNKLESSEIENYWKNGGNDVTADWSFNLNNASGSLYNYSWAVNSVEKMRLTAQGNLGVGITPEAVIHAHATVVGSAEVITLKASNTTASTSFFSIGINSLNNRTNLYAGGEVWATTISKWKFAAADVSGTWAFGVIPTCSVVPSNAAHLVNKAYVDSLSFVKKGDNVKTISLTNITLSGTQTVNGVALVANDLILVAGQTTGANNGVYVVAAGAWTRSTTNDADAEIRGAYHYISNGTYANQRYINTNTSAITVGTTAVTYSLDFGAETDPVWVAFRDANSITSTSITNWNTAFSNYIANTRAIAVLGTSGRISSSAGSQNLTADRNWTLDLVATGITAGTYRSITVDAYGRATAGTNPTTVAGYGITDFNSLFTAQLATKTTDNLSVGTTNKYYTNALFTADFNTKIGALVAFGNAISVAQTGFFYGNTNPSTNATGVLLNSDGTTANLRSYNPSTSLLKPLAIDGSTINIKVNGTAGANGSFFKSNGTVNSWAALTVSDITNIASTYQAKLNGTGFVKSTAGTISYDTNTYLTALDAVTLGTFEGERGFKLYSDTNKTFAEGIVFTNPDTGILGIHSYGLATDGSTITEFGFQIDKDGLLYHRKFDGSRAKILTTDDGEITAWNGGAVTNNIDLILGKKITFGYVSNQITYGTIETVQTATQTEFRLTAWDKMVLSAGYNIDINAPQVAINNLVFDTSNAAILSGGNAILSITSLGGGRFKASLIAG